MSFDSTCERCGITFITRHSAKRFDISPADSEFLIPELGSIDTLSKSTPGKCFFSHENYL